MASSVALAGCVIEPVELADKVCPCDRGWVCDSSVNRCVRDDAEEGGGGAIRVTGLRGQHPTSNEILWTWAVEGDVDEFDHYLLITGASLSDVIDGQVQVWGPAERAPLRVMETTPGEQAVATEHAPGTEVFAQVIALDRAGGAFVSNVNSASTRPEASGQVTVLDDELDHVVYPDWVEQASDGPATGASHQCVRVYCDADGDPVREDPGATAGARCGLNIQLGVAPASLAGIERDEAFLEAFVRVEGATEDVRLGRLYFYLRRDECEAQCATDWEHQSCQRCYWRREPIPLVADGDYHRVQIALSRFSSHADSDARLDADDLEHPLTQISVGGSWQHGSRVCVDAVRVRY